MPSTWDRSPSRSSASTFGVLVDQGVLRWNSTMAEMFPGLAGEMQPAYRPVTVASA